MTREEIKNIPEIVDFMLDKSVIADSRMKLHKRLEEICELAIKALEQEPCEDVVSRKSIKQKLQEHHDFFVNAYGGFSNLPQNDKSRVDEIINCIAMVVNEPPVTPQPDTARRIVGKSRGGMTLWYQCETCNEPVDERDTFCRGCGRRLIE